MTKAEWATLRRRWLARLRHALAVAARHAFVGMCMQGAMFDARSAMLVAEWPEHTRDSPDPIEPASLEDLPNPFTPPGHLERLIQDVPLSPRERELWDDLLGTEPVRPGRRRRRYRNSSSETRPTM